jgi:hypothetical protein
MRGISEFPEDEKGLVLGFDILTRWYFPILGRICTPYIQTDIAGAR